MEKNWLWDYNAIIVLRKKSYGKQLLGYTDGKVFPKCKW